MVHLSWISRCLTLVAGGILLFSSASCSFTSALKFDENGNSNLNEEIAPPPGPGNPQIRFLNAREYKNSVNKILGVFVTTTLEFGATRNGFETSADGQIDQGLLSALLDEAQSLANNYVETRLEADFTCAYNEGSDEGCIKSLIVKYGTKFFRRPVTPGELNSLYDYFRARELEDGHRTALKHLFARFLISPSFLYRTEVGKLSADNQIRQLDQFEIASLLAFTLTATTPDDLLLDDAYKAKLDADGIRSHVRRLLKTSDGRNSIVRFMKQWLKLDNLDDMFRNPARYPKLASPEQAYTLKREFEMFVKDVVLDGEGSLRSALTESITYIDRHTAYLYGLSSNSDSLERVTLDKSRRSGILTLASVMASHGSSSDINRDRPVQRGTLILEKVLCGDVGIPSGLDVVTAGNQAAAKVPNFHELTTREQFEIVMQQSETCIACHQTFMPFGYVLGNYNALGQFVTESRGRHIDVSVSNVPLGPSKKSFSGPMTFIEDLAAEERVYKCFAKQMAKYITGAESDAVQAMSLYFHMGFKRKKYDIKSLLEDFFAEEYLYRRKVLSQ